MRFARGDMRDHIVSHKNDHGASYGRYGAIAVVEPAKNQLLRDFRRRSIFDFCNTIGTVQTSRDVRLEFGFAPKRKSANSCR